MLPFVHEGNFKRPLMHVPGLLELAQHRQKTEHTTLVDFFVDLVLFAILMESFSRRLGPAEFTRRWRKAL